MKSVLILLPKGFELFEAAAFSDVFGWAREVGKLNLQAIFCGLNEEVVASFGYEGHPYILKPSILIDEVNTKDFDALALPGGFGKYGYYEEGFDERVLRLIRLFEEDRKPIGAVCTAALVLAKSGILKTRKATTYRRDNGMYFRQLESFCSNICDDDIAVDQNVITSSGPQTAPFVALKLLEMLSSKEAAQEIAAAMGFE